MQQTRNNLGHRKHRQAFGNDSISQAQRQSRQRMADVERERRRRLREGKGKQFTSIADLMKDHLGTD